MKTVKHKPKTWEKIYDLVIYDPDGWRTDKKSMKAPICEDEWYNRMVMSTCIFGKNALTKIKEYEKNNSFLPR